MKDILIIPLTLLALSLKLYSQTSTNLTDTIQKGIGLIDLSKDISVSNFDSYFNDSNTLYFGIDINENASGYESSTSQGVALKDFTLTVETTNGIYEFNDFEWYA